MEKLKYGVIGFGNRAKMLVEAAQDTGEVDITAYTVTGEHSRKAGQQLLPKATAYEDYKDLLQHGHMDAVMIATPNHLHTEIVLAALDAGLHVLCEKPLATTLEEIEQMKQKADSTGKILQVGFENRQSIRFREMKTMLLENDIGETKMLWCHEFRGPFRPGWRMNRESSGGTLLEKNVHHFDLFNWFAGAKPIRVQAIGSNDTVYANTGILDRAWVMVEYENGVQASLGLCLFHHTEKMAFGVMGDGGSMEYSKTDKSVTVSTPDRTSVHRYQNDMFEGNYHIGEREQQEAFIRAIKTGEQPETDAESAKWSHTIALAAEAAVRSGKTAKINPDGMFSEE